ncbi:MAG: hypothetical protein AB7I59_15160 [Geminicoccaceae bacterium]
MTATPLTSAETTHRNLLSLHRYWIYADKMKRLFFKELMSVDLKKITHAEVFLTDYCVYMFYWYGALYVVIEGYQELPISDAEIDRLLSDNRIYLLRRFRNGTFHYQPDYFSVKLLDFATSQGSATWAQSLHERLGAVLLARLTAAGAGVAAERLTEK